MFGNDPFLAFLALLVPLFYLAVPAALIYLALRFLRAYERRGAATAATAATAELTARMAALEEQLSRLSAESDRLAEGHRFTTALLAERAGGATGASASAPARPEPPVR